MVILGLRVSFTITYINVLFPSTIVNYIIKGCYLLLGLFAENVDGGTRIPSLHVRMHVWFVWKGSAQLLQKVCYYQLLIFSNFLLCFPSLFFSGKELILSSGNGESKIIGKNKESYFIMSTFSGSYCIVQRYIFCGL